MLSRSTRSAPHCGTPQRRSPRPSETKLPPPPVATTSPTLTPDLAGPSLPRGPPRRAAFETTDGVIGEDCWRAHGRALMTD
jgi:hypothetical protein